MTVKILISQLATCDQSAEVLLAHQPGYSLVSDIRGILEIPGKKTVYVAEGPQNGSVPEEHQTVLGWIR